MNFSGVKPKEIYIWINKKNEGDGSDYNKGKEDTQEAIGIFQSLYGIQITSTEELLKYLQEKLCMRAADSNSLYRAFIVLNNDEILSIRLSQHPATENSISKALKSIVNLILNII